MSIQERKCFLCPANLPAVQEGFRSRELPNTVNPFPIFPKHLTVPALEHVDQRIKNRFGDMLDLATYAQDYLVFYNGPKCGASAPEPCTLPGRNQGFLPLEQSGKTRRPANCDLPTATLSYLNDAPRNTLVLEATNREDAIIHIHVVYNAMEQKPGEEEPMMNLLTWLKADNGCLYFPAFQTPSSCYTAEGDAIFLSARIRRYGRSIHHPTGIRF